jgi:cytochrome c-type biogenesis protein CcsB
MKKILDFLYSSRMTVVLLLIFAMVIGAATFVEEKYDTDTAKELIYNSKWFEFLFVLLVVNFAGNIVRYNLFSRKKAPAFLFHFAFIVIILGAAITRYTGFTGTMRIRQGEASNTIYSSDPYLRIQTDDDKSYDIPVHMSQVGKNHLHADINTKDKGTISFDYQNIIKNAVEKIEENAPGGVNIIETVLPGKNGRESTFIKDGELKDFGAFSIAYNNNQREDAIKFLEKDGKTYISAPFDIKRTKMPEMTTDTVAKNTLAEVKEKCLHETPAGIFVIKKIYKSAKNVLVAGTDEEKGLDALGVNVTVNGKKHELQVLGGSGYAATYRVVDVDGYKFKIAYGLKEMELPFSLFLNQFILERYAGSMSPSSFTSDVTLIDAQKSIKENHKIFMNNVLDYNGYRFFQSSYDPDEKGTILSVNHDFYGTWVTYIGYLLMAIGFFLTLFNTSSRFTLLGRNIKKIRGARKAVAATAAMLAIAIGGNAQTGHVTAQHADKFAHLVVQTYDGRFEPAHSLAFDVMHKIARKDEFNVEGVGKMNAMQVFMDMILHSDFWKKYKLIYVREKSVRGIVGVEGSYAAYDDFFDAKGGYKLRDFAESSFRKKQSEQNTFDKEIIKVDERVNICMMTFNGTMLKIFPAQGAPNNGWISWDDTLATLPLTGSIKILNEDLQLRQFNTRSIMGLYLQEVYKATQSGNYDRAGKILGYISGMQRQSTAAAFLPTESKIDKEIQYNKAKIFIMLRDSYSMLSMVLLVLAFIDILSAKKNKVIRLLLNVSIGVLACLFVYHTYGLVLRWYLTGHAPWSTGYEALLLVAWGGLLAGFFFIRNSKITIAATTLLAFFVLMTAGHSSYDPQLTNLQPVLKSYWLIIHVATLTISYGFLGLGFILGLINLVIYLFKTNKNYRRLDMVTHELSQINEMNVTIGLFLATVGTFLGGIWANESWGKYWGWDAKETWALVIVITYTIVLHMRFASKLKGEYMFNTASVLGYSSVLMTFFGVNYYLSKGMHSYAAGDTPVFPMWAWVSIFSILALIVAAWFKHNSIKRQTVS